MQFGEPRPEAGAEVMRAQAQRAVEVRKQLADIVGEASSDDTYVRAVVGADGLTGLDLHPKAMRMPSTDLATTVVEVTRLAREDLERRRSDKAAELGSTGRPDLNESLAHLERLRAMVDAGHGDLRAAFERFRDQTGR